MMHKDEGLKDGFELICSIPDLRVRRYRMRSTREITGLDAGPTESLIVVLNGRADITIAGRDDTISLGEKDTCYLPRETSFSVRTGVPTELIWAQAPAEKSYPAYVRRFSEMNVVEAGMAPYSRRVIPTIREQDQANRFLAGFVEGEQGNWTSFPPHKHDGKPEVYIYYGMGKRFGVQVIGGADEKAFVVRDGDAVAFERGYHPNVATPGVGMSFLWIISADPRARDMSVDFHPDYKDLPVGKTHLSTR